MSRRVSSFAGTITLFVAFLAAFASASPADVPRGDLGVERRNNEVEGVPSQPDTTDTINDFSATVYKGDATWYVPGLGECGILNSPIDFIVALSPADFGHRSTCGKEVRITHRGKTATVTVQDLCFGCSEGNVDLSPVAFEAIAPLDKGRVQVTWEFV